MKELLKRLFGHWHSYQEVKRTDWYVEERCDCGKDRWYYPI